MGAHRRTHHARATLLQSSSRAQTALDIGQARSHARKAPAGTPAAPRWPARRRSRRAPSRRRPRPRRGEFALQCIAQCTAGGLGPRRPPPPHLPGAGSVRSRRQPSPRLPSRRRCAAAAAAASRRSGAPHCPRCCCLREALAAPADHVLPWYRCPDLKARTSPLPQPGGGKKGGAAPRGFSDHNAKWLKPKPRQEEPSSEDDEELDGEEELSLSGEEFSDDGSDGALGSDGASRCRCCCAASAPHGCDRCLQAGGSEGAALMRANHGWLHQWHITCISICARPCACWHSDRAQRRSCRRRHPAALPAPQARGRRTSWA